MPTPAPKADRAALGVTEVCALFARTHARTHSHTHTQRLLVFKSMRSSAPTSGSRPELARARGWLESRAGRRGQHLPVPLQTDFKDGFTNAKRRLMLTTARSLFPSLLRYLYTCYDSVGKLWMLDSGQLVEAFDCGEGIWQGDPLGNSCFSMAIYTFMELLKAKLRPEASQGRQASGSAVSWIVDDCTMVPRRFKAVELVKSIIDNVQPMDCTRTWTSFSPGSYGQTRTQVNCMPSSLSLVCRYLSMGWIDCLEPQLAHSSSWSGQVGSLAGSLRRLPGTSN